MHTNIIKFLDEDKQFLKRRKKQRNWIIFSRTIIFLLLLTALATPFNYGTQFIQGEPKVKVLIDNSTSFQLFDQKEGYNFIDQISDNIEVEIKSFGLKNSNIGDVILENLKENDNILLISDGNNNYGTDLNDVAKHAKSLNATINALNLKAKEVDASIKIIGPSKTTSNVENTYKIIIDQSLDGMAVPVIVSVDGKQILTTKSNKENIEFTKKFTKGYHTIEAKINSRDYFRQNNLFYKTVKVVPKPKILLYSEKDSSLEELFDPIYDITKSSTLPTSLDEYTAIIINDISAEKIEPKTTILTNFVADGNGLFVIGGMNSYDKGNYKDSLFEQMLPVSISQSGKKEGEINIVIVLDISGSTGSYVQGDTFSDIEKAIAISIIEEISKINKLGVVAFNTESHLVNDLKYLLENEQEVIQNIGKLTDGGGTRIDVGIVRAIEMLQTVPGSKNLILISDGKTHEKEKAMAAAKLASDSGMKLYTVGIGKNTKTDMMEILASLGNGAAYQIDEKEKLKILFGDNEEFEGQDSMGIVIMNSNHFITKGIDKLPATLYGFNQVFPKSTASLLLTTNTGDPILTSWRYGLGRISSLSTDDGTIYAAELLNKQNSRIFTRTMNWAIGDPERKNEKFISIDDTRIHDPTQLLVKSQQQPVSDEISFMKIDEDLYKANLIPNETGFQKVLTATFASNYPIEYENIGINENLKDIALSTGGKVFELDQSQEASEFIISNSKRTIYKKLNYSWPLLILALIIYLIEVCIRRVINNKKLYKE